MRRLAVCIPVGNFRKGLNIARSAWGAAVAFPDEKQIAAISESIEKFQRQLTELADQPESRKRCREALRALMMRLQAFANRLRDE